MKNTSDSIENYIKELIARFGVAEIKRSHLADDFSVVPSQINYVLKTRFTPHQGYVVESKRGGGGYIRIEKVRYSDDHQLISQMLSTIGEQISQTVFVDVIQLLFDEGIFTQREGELIIATASDEVLGSDADKIRARLLKQVLQRLDRKG